MFLFSLFRSFAESFRRITARPLFWIYAFIILQAGIISVYLTARKDLRPKLEMPEFDTTNLGDGEVGQVLTGIFYLRNRGSAPLDFKLHAGCVCTELSPMQGRIGPGEMQSIHVGIRLRYRGKEEIVPIQVETNDLETPSARHNITARNVAPFIVSPAAVDFGTVMEDGKLRTTSLRVFGPDVKSLPADVTVTAGSDNPYLAIQPGDGQPGERSFLVTLRKGVPRGHFSGSVKVWVSTDTAPYDVLVTAHVCGPVAFAPQTVYLPLSEGAGEECNILVWRPDGQPLGKLVER